MELTNKANRLITEHSPYLLQHAYNPVEWYAWGQEAFDKAKKEDKPVFLSIGYSTCHWCHVMAHESFEDEEVAALLNRDFVAVKVDKEERPDIDAVYMTVCQALTGQGGWPLTILMTPAQKPFYAGTYLPKTSRGGMAGLMELLAVAAEQWRKNRDAIVQSGEQITEAVKAQSFKENLSETPGLEMPEKAAKLLKSSFDSEYGGFSHAPKFPTPHNLLFLLKRYTLLKDSDALKMAETTLRRMYRGGIFDHIGFGFSRYSTDTCWLAPHFEKMLYDNALLVMAYLEAYRITEAPLYREVAEKTLEYIAREMTSPEGGFYSAQDADSEGVEGKYYLFKKDEIEQVLGDAAEGFCKAYGVTKLGNFEGGNILNLIENKDYETISGAFEQERKKLYEYRKSRMKLHKDDKQLTSWNALMIAAYARAYRILGKEEYLKAAERAAALLLKPLMGAEEGLRVGFREGKSFGPAHLDDYAFLAWACLELYAATYHAQWFTNAVRLAERMREDFLDSEQGGFFLNSEMEEPLLYRPKEVYDGAIPSGNSVVAYVFNTLSRLTGEEVWRSLSEKQMIYCAGEAQRYPAGFCFFQYALLHELLPSQELICVLQQETLLEEVRKELLRLNRPNLYTMIITPGNKKEISKANPFAAGCKANGKPTVFYLCGGGACQEPFYELGELEKRLNGQ
ncbi:thioredoxin domain-containing protein [Acetanaerobacterium elongatum]|uniref:Spermatogenesis-associated protein 20-like TRX domain-containing protein n=1 Tax=Acetanaerobacterium elongatum TaxID=258515 RepID=A0A1H0FV28_9FIRM|nr:thioredoxin domain-containing protein [Acetanaerobacterium elongatum]SDN98339.1 hypothetical protein SAMN05192585_1442 [Acetanaerobacterium elongatum]